MTNTRLPLQDLPKSNVFTQNLPPDPKYPTPESSHAAKRSDLGPRLVKDALYTYVRPDTPQKSELLAVSDAAVRDLAIDPSTTTDSAFLDIVSGRQTDAMPGIYPWAQCYGGYQFGQWAGQLGDGRAISLFETTNPNTNVRHEVQLKGAGRTPYSRFADGRAVLRSSIREFVVSEALNALKIPSTRALSLTLLPDLEVRRERVEPGAIVARFAQSWIRVGTFDLPRSRGDRKTVRTLADYVAEHVIPIRDPQNTEANTDPGPAANTATDIDTELASQVENRYARLYREIVRRNAKTVAAWQAYAFTNGVLNTDNTSILGLSLDFGPFAFLDNFDPNYSPNHDDYTSRYSYKNQPDVILWNLVRLGEALGELIGVGPRVDDQDFIDHGITHDQMSEVVERAEKIIGDVGIEYKAVFAKEYARLMTARLGFSSVKTSDEDLRTSLLDILESLELDYNHTFRKLSHLALSDLATDKQRLDVADRFFHSEGSGADARSRLANWLQSWADRAAEEGTDDITRQAQMKAVNPKFMPRSWILDELIDRVENKGERDILQNIMKMALNPFAERWDWNETEEERFCGDVPRGRRAMQCSCSS